MKRNNLIVNVVAMGALIYLSGQLGYGNLFKVLAAYGYGGGGVAIGGSSSNGGAGSSAARPVVTSVATNGFTVPLIISNAQSGSLSQALSNNAQVDLSVPKGAVSGVVTFTISSGEVTTANAPKSTIGAFMVGNQVFNIDASDSSGAVRSFSEKLSVTITVPEMPASTEDLGVYYFSEAAQSWVLVPGASFDPASRKVNFSVDHLTKFAVMKVSGLPSTIEASKQEANIETDSTKTFADGSLIRGSDGKVYIIEDQKKRLISNLVELRRYTGQKIYNVSNDILAGFPTSSKKITVIDIVEPSKEPVAGKTTTTTIQATTPSFKNGELIRALDGRIYVVDNGKKIKIDSLAELGAYRGKPIKDVSDRVLALFPDASPLSEGNLVRKMDMKVYVIKNGIKEHILNLSDLAKYAGKKIFNIVEGVFNK